MPIPIPDYGAGGKWLHELPTTYSEPWLLESIWTRSGFNLMVGAPKSRKSTLRRYWTACALAGQPAFGKFSCVSPAKKAWLAFGEGPLEAEGAANHLVFANGESLLANRLKLNKLFGFRLDSVLQVSALKAFLAGEGFDLVMFDPLLYFHGQDENDNRGMGRVCEGLLSLAEVAAVVVVHHTAKTMPGLSRSVVEAGRGSSTLAGAAEVVIRVTRPGMGNRHKLEFVTRGAIEPEKLNLVYHPETRAWHATSLSELGEKVLNLIRQRPGIIKNDVVEVLRRRREDILEQIEHLQRLNLVTTPSETIRSHQLYVRGFVPDPKGTPERI